MKNVEKLIERFKKIESEIIKILNEKLSYFDENDEEYLVKKSIKEYIKKVNKAKKLFAEYEQLAKQIEEINNDDGESGELSKTVFEFGDSALIQDLRAKEDNNVKIKDKVSNNKLSKRSNKTKESIKEL